MQLTSDMATWMSCPEPFFKATAQGVQECYTVSSAAGSLGYEGRVPLFSGYVCDSLFIKLDFTNPNSHPHFDQKGAGFFTSREEAQLHHRELVLEYIQYLNSSTLQTYPINAI